MDFLLDFLKALFIERDKEKIKNSILVIAVAIIAGFLWNFFMDMKESIDNMSQYRIVIIQTTDSIFTAKSNIIVSDFNDEIEKVIKLVHNLDNKRAKEINYIVKYKDKNYQEIMDILEMNNSRWEYEASRVMSTVEYAPMMSMEMAVSDDDNSVDIIEPELNVEAVEPKLIELDTMSRLDEHIIMTTPSYEKKEKKPFFKRIFGKNND